jgi:hypothetical protein
VRPFTFQRTFVIPAPVDRVQAVLVDLEFYSAWWPEVVAVAKLSDDDALVVCRSALPYELELHLTAVHREPERLEVAIDGDLVGFARFELFEDPAGARLEFTEEVAVAGAALRLAVFIGRPLLVWNHDRMMASCIEGLTRVTTAPAGEGQASMWDMSP